MNLRSKALKLCALRLGASGLEVSNRRYKKFVVTYNGKKIHFGDNRYLDYTQHKDKERRDRYRSRHKKIKLKDGTLAYKNKNQAAYWSLHLLWT